MVEISTLHIDVKAPWSWGRMHDILSCILSEGRKIESRCQLEQINRTNWKRHKRKPVNDHKDALAGARKGLDLKLVKARKRDSIRRMWTKKEREPREEKDVKGGRNSTKHSKDELQHENKTG